MKLLRFLHFFSKKQRSHHHYHNGRDFNKGNSTSRAYNAIFSSKGTDEQTCQLCKNHCSLSALQCDRGKSYTKKQMTS